MNDYSEGLERILNDPAAMEQVKALSRMLMSSTENGTALPAGPAPVPTAPAAPAPPAPPAPPATASGGLSDLLGSGDMMKTVMKMAPLFGRFQEENDSTRLLYALRPFLSPARQEKLDRAVRLLRLFRLLPVLQEMGGSLL